MNEQYTIRKQNGFGVFDCQSPARILKTPRMWRRGWASATQIYLPEPGPTSTTTSKVSELTEKEFGAIRSLGEGVASVPRAAGGTVPVSSNSNWVRWDLLDILSTSLDNVELLDQIRAEVGDAPADWMPAFRATAGTAGTAGPCPLLVLRAALIGPAAQSGAFRSSTWPSLEQALQETSRPGNAAIHAAAG